MAETDTGRLLPPDAWRVETLRVTAFPIPAAPAKDYGWWTTLVGEPPESTTDRHRESMRREEGPFCGGRLVSDVRPLRIDWLLIPSQDESAEAADWRSVGSLPEVVEPFIQLMLRWFGLESCPAIVRLAFAAVVFHPVETKDAGYRQLDAYLPSVQLDAEGASDFLYKINRQRPSDSSVSSLVLNRLSTWSVSMRQKLGIVIEQSGPAYAEFEKGAYACRLELDINTGQGRREELPRDSLHRLLLELVELAKEIVAKGVIP